MVMVEAVTESGAEAVHWQYFATQNNTMQSNGSVAVMVRAVATALVMV